MRTFLYWWRAARIRRKTRTIHARNERNQIRLDGMMQAREEFKAARAAGDAQVAAFWATTYNRVAQQWEYLDR
jgi:hypothetical protein